MIDIHDVMTGLARCRPIFHSEADFQHALAWRIRETTPDIQIRLEFKPLLGDGRSIHLDIWIPSAGLAIELKYPTQRLHRTLHDEPFGLAEQGAQPIRRYDFLDDVQRLEHVVEQYGPAKGGYAILLTNVPNYWNLPRRGDAIDADFRVHERRHLSGRLSWSANAGAGTRRGRESDINLRGSYDLLWRDYSVLGAAGNERFRYLAVRVTSPT